MDIPINNYVRHTSNTTYLLTLGRAREGGTNASRSDGTRVAMVQDTAALSQQGNAMIH